MEYRTLGVILTGATGYVGEGVLLECLANPAVERVLVVTRRRYDGAHPKLKQLIVPDFMALEEHAAQLSGYDACFYCAGASSAGMSEEEYRRVTCDVTLHFAAVTARHNPRMVFCHISGHDVSGRKEKRMWARVKWETENALMALGISAVYNIRAGIMNRTPGQRNVNFAYRVVALLYPWLRARLPAQVSTMREVGLAMINVALKGHPSPILEVPAIRALAAA
jgi:uncharacterized protein YbjT (DUF2867 family)